MKLFILTLSLISAVGFSQKAMAVPHGKVVEQMLHSPGARELMDEEVTSWSLETKHMKNDAVAGGTVVLRGTPSPAQRFNRGKLVPCQVRLIGSGQFAATRNSCDLDHPVYLPLSVPGQAEQAVTVPAGFYVLGFENSVYPGFLQVKAGSQTAIDLQQVTVPAGGAVKIYRDLNALTEETKMYFTTYVLGASLFKEAEYSFGDLYIKTFGTRDGAAQLNYKTCELSKQPAMTPQGTRLCKAWNSGSFMTLNAMFDFASNGSFQQYEVGPQGMSYPYPMGRLLVAKQTSSDVASFVNVLPGQYVVEVSSGGKVISARSTGAIGGVDAINALTMNIGWIPSFSQLKLSGVSSIVVPQAIDASTDPNAPSAATLAAASDDGGDYVDTSLTCGSAKMWRTELRGFCRNDATPGCARAQAKMCEPMYEGQ